MSAPDVDDGPYDQNDDDRSLLTAELNPQAGGSGPVGPSPNSHANVIPDIEQAAAMAEVSAMDGPTRGRLANRAGEEAVMGVAAGEGVAGFEVTDESGELVKQRFLDFLGNYFEQIDRTENQAGSDDNDVDRDNLVYPYAEQATQMAERQLRRRSINPEDAEESTQASAGGSIFSSTLFVDFTNIMDEDMELAEALQSDFLRFEPFLRRAVQSFVLELHPELDDPTSSTPYNQTYFVAMHNFPTVLPVRQLRTDRIGRLSCVSGTVTRTSEVRPELLVGSFRCSKCGLLAENIQQQYHYTRPNICRNPRCQNASPMQFVLETSTSEFVDWQKLRVQENSDEIPPGSMPRSMDVIVRNEMVERAKAGDKCVFTGSLVVIPDGSALARVGEAPRAVGRGNRNNADGTSGGGGGVSGLKALGVRELTYRTCFVATSVLPLDAIMRASSTSTGPKPNYQAVASLLFGTKTLENHEPSAEEVVMELSREEREEIRDMKSSPRLYEDMVESMCPSTFGHKEVKKGILLMLLGGIHKTTTDGTRLRGDINVCIVGDPSTAKSQFLKYVHAFLPSRAVYTSGKASSAAGLTAAVQRDQDTGEYCIEAGALMLADNGICCIDEFDKMDPFDQVAIHEAMEQQTISITKAGIQATLNARASILAAANPIYGRYDRTKTLKANVALSSPILSRFDLFFVVLDECNVDADTKVAKHILKFHRCQEESVHSVPYTKEQMQRYIRFARTINPKISEESKRVFVDCYIKLRQGDTLGQSRAAYRITVRQLESMIRLSEALARLHCDQEIQPVYVREAFRLLKTSIIQVETSDIEIGGDDDDDENDEGNNIGALEPDGGDNADNEGINETESHPETQQASAHPGEYGSEEAGLMGAATSKRSAEQVNNPSKKKKRKTKITADEFEAIAGAIATHLRSIEGDDEAESSRHLKWSEVVEWYLEQVEQDIGDSLELLEEMRRKLNLVIRRLINVEKMLVTIGDSPKNKKEEQQALLAVHPNFPMT